MPWVAAGGRPFRFRDGALEPAGPLPDGYRLTDLSLGPSGMWALSRPGPGRYALVVGG